MLSLSRLSRFIPSFNRTMSTQAPVFKPFNLALIQLGQVTSDKSANLIHAREMIRKAAAGEGTNASGKPDLIVLPVSIENLDADLYPFR